MVQDVDPQDSFALFFVRELIYMNTVVFGFMFPLSPSIRPLIWNNSITAEQIVVNFHRGKNYDKLPRQFSRRSNLFNIILHENLLWFLRVSRYMYIFWREKTIFPTNIVQKNETHLSCIVNLLQKCCSYRVNWIKLVFRVLSNFNIQQSTTVPRKEQQLRRRNKK